MKGQEDNTKDLVRLLDKHLRMRRKKVKLDETADWSTEEAGKVGKNKKQSTIVLLRLDELEDTVEMKEDFMMLL